MEEMTNNKNKRKEIEKQAERLADQEMSRYVKDMQEIKDKDNNSETKNESEDDEETIGPSIEFKDDETVEDVIFKILKFHFLDSIVKYIFNLNK